MSPNFFLSHLEKAHLRRRSRLLVAPKLVETIDLLVSKTEQVGH